MEADNQFTQDSAKLAALIERYTGIPKERIFHFVMENAAAELLPCADMICETDAQKDKLAALFEFKRLYETIKGAERHRTHKLTSSRDARDYFKNLYADKNDKEYFTVAFLDSQGRVIAAKQMFTGTVDESAVYSREIVKSALFYNAASVMLAHNHPGGSEKASQTDIKMTDTITQHLHMVGVKMQDHIIVAGDNAVSLAEQGIILTSGESVFQKAASPIRENCGPLRANTKQPSIKQQIAAGKKQLDAERAAAPLRAAAKSKNIGLGD